MRTKEKHTHSCMCCFWRLFCSAIRNGRRRRSCVTAKKKGRKDSAVGRRERRETKDRPPHRSTAYADPEDRLFVSSSLIIFRFLSLFCFIFFSFFLSLTLDDRHYCFPRWNIHHHSWWSSVREGEGDDDDGGDDGGHGWLRSCLLFATSKFLTRLSLCLTLTLSRAFPACITITTTFFFLSSHL